jgi:hypothetical protein
MAGSVRTIGASLALGLLGCTHTGPRPPRVPSMFPEGATALAQWGNGGTLSRCPPCRVPGVYAPSRSWPEDPRARVLLPGPPLASVRRQAPGFDGMSDGKTLGSSGAGGKSTRTGAGPGGKAKREEPVKCIRQFCFGEVADVRQQWAGRRDRPRRRSDPVPGGGATQAALDLHTPPGPRRFPLSGVKAEVDASAHPHHPNGRACLAQKDGSCYPVLWPNQYL